MNLFSKGAIALVAALSLLVPATATASHDDRPAPPEGYPYCHDDPDVSCYEPPGYDMPDSTYQSGQYPEGWYEERYNPDGTANDYRQCELGRCQTPQPTGDPGQGFGGGNPDDRPDDPTPAPVAPKQVADPDAAFWALIMEVLDLNG